MSNRLTFSLASLVLIFALVFATMPAMSHDGHDPNPGHPVVTISEAPASAYTAENPKARNNYKLKIVATVNDSSDATLFEDSTLETTDVTARPFTADGIPGSNINPGSVAQTPGKAEWIATLDLSGNTGARRITVRVNANTFDGNREGALGGNEVTTQSFTSLPSVLSLTAELAVASTKANNVAIPGRYTLTVTFKDGSTAATPNPTPTLADIVVTPKGNAVPVNAAGDQITDMSEGLTAGTTGVYTQNYQLTFGVTEATLGLISGYATNAPSKTIPPPVTAEQNPPAAMITVSET